MVDWIKFPDNKPQKGGLILCLSPTVGVTLATYSVERETFSNLRCCWIRDVEYYIEIPNLPKDFHRNISIETVKRLS